MSRNNGQKLVSSKDILEKTNISRATLNNYIKMGIFPRPVVRKPGDGENRVKSLGYFPDTVFEIIEKVKMLKQQKHSMVEIASILRDQFIPEQKSEEVLPQPLPAENQYSFDRCHGPVLEEGLRLSFGNISSPAYLLNYNFEILWINREAEVEILNQRVTSGRQTKYINIFSLFFKWGFHSRIVNWKDLVAFHIAFVKFKYSRTWLIKLYKGMSQEELGVLEEIYDNASVFPYNVVIDNPISFMMQDSSTEKYRIYSIFSNEGIMFIYNPDIVSSR